MSSQEDRKPVLANLVQAGEQQKEAESITDFIFMAKDISNAYLVTTRDGDVMVDRKSTRLNSSHLRTSRMPSSA